MKKFKSGMLFKLCSNMLAMSIVLCGLKYGCTWIFYEEDAPRNINDVDLEKLKIR